MSEAKPAERVETFDGRYVHKLRAENGRLRRDLSQAKKLLAEYQRLFGPLP